MAQMTAKLVHLLSEAKLNLLRYFIKNTILCKLGDELR
ncbi:hypothetical protein CFter6_3230 [Collimonas fungivorans]|uniref:Uncharacterized protein n=1 Tax=Collimonas fungivorans TaxID=158899 RepID=A0A127PDJ7_9BURK|nr:hypothetical protein CFter6_3230 [Collimonas fungivorans]